MANLGEIASRAGVSRSTVSYVLSGKRQIGADTRARVLSIIDELGYRPNAAARALAAGTTSTIALVVPPSPQGLTTEQLGFVGAVAQAAAEHGYDTLLSPTPAGPEVLDRFVGERRVDGIVLMELTLHDPRVEILERSRFPFVAIGRAGDEPSYSWVDLDYAGLVSEAVDRLVAQGHRHLAFVNRPQHFLDREYEAAVRSLAAFTDTCARHDVAATAVCSEDLDSAAGAALTEAFAADPQITAVVSINEFSVGGIVSWLVAHDRSVPGDVSVVAVAPARIAEVTAPPVTSADIPALEMSTEAVRILLAQIADPDAPPRQLLLHPEFVDRGSSAPLPA